MQLRQLLRDDDAVSPVIGVILMVAITVILAAVIATFVLGLGEQISETSPNTSFTFDYENVSGSVSDEFGDSAMSNAILTITHAGGPNINSDQVTIIGGINDSVLWADANSAPSKISAGDSVDYAIEPDDTVRVTWENEEATRSATLQNYRGPEA